MALISFRKDFVVDFMPEYGGNRESKTPCIIGLTSVPYSEVQRYSRLIATGSMGVTDPAEAAEISKGVQREQFVEHVKHIKNYFVCDADGEREITDPGEFYDTADTGQVREVIQAMETASLLDKGQRKNFAPGSDGSTPHARPAAPLSAAPVRLPIEGSGTAKTPLDLETR